MSGRVRCSVIFALSMQHVYGDNRIQSIASNLTNTNTTVHSLGSKTTGLVEEYAKDDFGTLNDLVSGRDSYAKKADGEATSRVALTALIFTVAVGASWSGMFDKLGKKLPRLFGGVQESQVDFMSYIGYSSGLCGLVVWPLAVNDAIGVGAKTTKNIASYLKDPTVVGGWGNDLSKLENKISAAIIAATAATVGDIPNIEELDQKIVDIAVDQIKKHDTTSTITRYKLINQINTNAILDITTKNKLKKWANETPMEIIQNLDELPRVLESWINDVHQTMGRDTKQQCKQLGNDAGVLFKDAAVQAGQRVAVWFGIFATSTLALHAAVYHLGITKDLHNYINNDWARALNSSAHLRHAYQAFTYGSTGVFVAFTVYPIGTKIHELWKKAEQNKIKPSDLVSCAYSLKSLAA